MSQNVKIDKVTSSEEAALLGGRLEGWPLARPCLLPSFETRAIEIGCCRFRHLWIAKVGQARLWCALLRVRSELFYALSAQPSYATSSPRLECSGDLFLQLLPCAPQRLEREMHAMCPGPDGHGAEQHIGLENVGREAVHFGAPPGMPDIVEDEEAAIRRVCLDIDLGVRIALYAGAAGNPLPALPRKRGRVYRFILPRLRGRV